MDDLKLNPIIVALLGSGVVVAIVREASRLLTRRRPTVVEDYEHLVDQLQQEVSRLAQRVADLERHEDQLRQAADAHAARMIVELHAIRDAGRVQVEALYADLEKTRIRLSDVERENAALRKRLSGEETLI